MRLLKSLDLNNAGVVPFYFTNARSVLTYASPVWFSPLSDFSKNKLVKVQRSAARIVLPHRSYEESLKILQLLPLYAFIACLSKTYFIKTLHSSSHPLFIRLTFTNSRTSSHRPNTFRTAKTKTSAYTNSFFQSQMKFLNNF